ncbi:hypothetical protein TD95_004803 [Thielaviopsis punctulata]|uniref:Nucleolar pre-ribosomal-associated protein 1 N-terminal domain-containing protein n=1 Tax=Thielaviopsis punctulata TaxID=72032 RepID=A0A0F4ZHD2_9PEZI|nr:hypothetical protein TD95_004803 [Thielaviopsis punctulata]
MGKRQFRERDREADGSFQDGPMSIRKKLKVVHETPTSEPITSSRQMRMLLSFDHDARKTRHGLQSFKLFLDALNSPDGEGNASDNREMLSLFLKSTAPRPEDDDGVYLDGVFQTWAYGVQTHNDGLLSSVAVVLGLLLQVISADLSMVRHGMGICEALLQDRHLKLMARNLSSDPSKGFVISPTLRLLREIISLDGGVFARRVFRARQYTLAEFVRNLEVKHGGEGVEDLAKASVRTNSIRVFNTFLRYLPSDDRKELVLTRGLMSHLTFLFKDDAPSVLSELLESLTKYFLMDAKIPSYAKSTAFNAKMLSRMLNLYNYNHDANETVTISDKVHSFLLLACTSKDSGAMLKSTGMYPEGLDSASVTSGRERSGLMGVESLSWMDRYKTNIPVYNTSLLEFILKLRPWANLKHSELLVGCFSACPELVAAYFQKQISFTFDPKLSMTWIGYAAFLFNTIQLPLPNNFGDAERLTADIPPPTSVLLDNILPPALNQKVLTRCLDPKSALVSFFVTRLLVVSMQKLQKAVKMHGDASESAVWTHAQRKLLDGYCDRIPEMKEVIRAYKAIPVENVLHRATASHLLSLYYKNIPQIALAANFDASPLLISTLNRLETKFENPKDKAVVIIELENLLEIASYSPGMRWFNKAEGLPTSPFTSLLQLACNKSHVFHSSRLEEVLSSIAAEHQMVSKSSGLRPLIEAVRKSDDISSEEWAVLDNCTQRASSSPLKYLDLLTEYIGDEESSRSQNISLLLVTLAEQIPHVCKSADEDTLMSLAELISEYANLCVAEDESESSVAALCIRMKEYLPWLALPKPPKTKKEKKSSSDKATTSSDPDTMDTNEPSMPSLPESEYNNAIATICADLEEVTVENAALTRWVNKSPEELIDDTYATEVFKLLLSEHTSIRREALTNLLKMAAKVKESSHPEKEQVWLLISELAESAKPFVADGPVPSQFVAFAVHALPILCSPLHALYPKINRYLTKGPVWAPAKLLLIHDVLHGEPSEDDKLYIELSWLFSYLLDCLHIKEDLAVFYRNSWWEKILCAACNPNLRVGLRSKVHKLLYRASCLEGGSTMLITRFGIISWLATQEAQAGKAEDKVLYKALIQRMWSTCDVQHVEKWSGQKGSKQ